MEREFKEVTTPKGQKLVKFKTWLTGRERRDIRSLMLDSLKFSSHHLQKAGEDKTAKDKESDVDAAYELDGSTLTKMQDKTIEVVVVSVDGETSNILDKVLDMHEEDYQFLIDEINASTSGVSEEDKKK